MVPRLRGAGRSAAGALVNSPSRGAIAQLEEHLHGMQGVRGSSPRSSTNDRDRASMTKPQAASRRLRGVRHPLHLLFLALVLIVAACSAAPGASGPPGSSTPATSAPSLTPPSQQPASTASQKPAVGTVYAGVFSMDDIEGGCAYLGTADGRKLQVIYPEGWSITKAPLKLIAPDGSVHSRAGDIVSIRGAEATDMASICQIGPIIQATEVLDR